MPIGSEAGKGTGFDSDLVRDRGRVDMKMKPWMGRSNVGAPGQGGEGWE